MFDGGFGFALEQVEVEQLAAEAAARDALIPRAPLFGVAPIAEALAAPLPPRPPPAATAAATAAAASSSTAGR